jgi:hypothetical protein
MDTMRSVRFRKESFLVLLKQGGLRGFFTQNLLKTIPARE